MVARDSLFLFPVHSSNITLSHSFLAYVCHATSHYTLTNWKVFSFHLDFFFYFHCYSIGFFTYQIHPCCSFSSVFLCFCCCCYRSTVAAAAAVAAAAVIACRSIVSFTCSFSAYIFLCFLYFMLMWSVLQCFYPKCLFRALFQRFCEMMSIEYRIDGYFRV